MKKWILAIIAGLIISMVLPAGDHGLLAADGYSSDPADTNAMPGNEAAGVPTTGVQTTLLKRGSIAVHIDCYGQVIAAPGALQTISIPFESRMLGVMVNEGQKVSKGDVLIDIVPSPDTKLELDQAQNADELAREGYRQMERRYKLKLATNEQLLQAKQVLDEARLRLTSMRNRGIDGEHKITAGVGGLVQKIYVQEGSIVPAGNPVIDIVAQNRVEVLLGVEPENIEKVHPDQAVSITRVSVPTSPEAAGKVRKISYAVNPETRLVDVFISLTSPARFLLGESVEGKIVTTTAEGLIVPRSAVLPEGNRHVLFTVKNGHAVKHEVSIGIETAEAYEITDSDLQAGDKVVISGNYELTDGMAVIMEAGQ